MPSKIEENLPPTNEGYGTKEYWYARYPRPELWRMGQTDIQGTAVYQVRFYA
jgi:hypothetical protein